MEINHSHKLVLFQSKQIRRIWHENQWYFSIVDACGALTESLDSKDYWYRLKTRLNDEEKAQLSTICRQLKLPSSDGKKYATEKAI